MRTPFLAGNWKMNLTSREITPLLEELAAAVTGVEGRDILVCPAFPYLAQAVAALGSSQIAVGAQDCHHEESGAFTGEVSPLMLKDIGATHVILGHSERRHIMGESDEVINRKVRAVIKAGLDPILCVGETLEERQAERTWAVIETQLEHGLDGLDGGQCGRLTIAYEPVWAIGTGLTATPEQAQDVHAQIRTWVERRFDATLAAGMRILYGGSVNPKTVDGLMAQTDVDGGLVGGAALKAADFARIVRFESAS